MFERNGVAQLPNLDAVFRAEIARRAAERSELEVAAHEARLAVPRSGLMPFTMHTNAGYLPGWFSERVCDELDAFLEAVVRKESPRLMLLAPPRHGKALALETPIPTPAGWVAIESLRPGDSVFAGDGSITTVVAVSPVWRDREVYRVITDTGAELIADAAHEWPVRLCRKQRAVTRRETQMLYARQSAMREWRAPLVQMHGGLDLPAAHLPVGPYTLGAWLGDRRTTSGFITQGAEDAPHVLGRIAGEGYRLRAHADPRNTGVLGLQVQLRAAGVLGAKHIPGVYLRASRAQRVALLQGLIDTDGHTAPDGQIEFCSTSAVLADGVQELVRSLGVKATTIVGRATLYGRDCGPKYRVMFYFAEAASTPRKAARCRSGVRTPGNYLHIEPAGRADTVCIEVAHPSHLFLAGDGMLPTCNSELASRRFPAYALGRYPDLEIIAASYASSLAKAMSKDAQRIIDHPTYAELFPETRLAGMGVRGRTKTTRTDALFGVVGHKGVYRAAGVGVGITGTGGDVVIIDDPVKDAQEAASQVSRDGVWDWYTSTLYTRLSPGAGILLMLTRWNEDDLAGRLLTAMTDGTGETWKVIRFPALAEEGRMDPDDPRDIGEALHPARWSKARLETTKRVQGGYFWNALYQQFPSAREGTLLKPDLIEIVDALPPMQKEVRGWDLAGSRRKAGKSARSGPDFTAGVKIGRTFDGRIVITDAKHLQERPSTVRATVKATASQDGGAVGIRIPQDPGQAGVDQKEQYARELAGYIVKFVPVSGDKEIRATPLASMIEAQNVLMLRGDWNKALIEEMRSFPNGSHDDLVDAAAEAFNELVGVVPGEGLMEYYRQEAEKATLRALAGGDDAPVGPDGRDGYRPPPGLQAAFGLKGEMYRPDSQGVMWIVREDVAAVVKGPGWEAVTQDVEEA